MAGDPRGSGIVTMILKDLHIVDQICRWIMLESEEQTVSDSSIRRNALVHLMSLNLAFHRIIGRQVYRYVNILTFDADDPVPFFGGLTRHVYLPSFIHVLCISVTITTESLMLTLLRKHLSQMNHLQHLTITYDRYDVAATLACIKCIAKLGTAFPPALFSLHLKPMLNQSGLVDDAVPTFKDPWNAPEWPSYLSQLPQIHTLIVSTPIHVTWPGTKHQECLSMKHWTSLIDASPECRIRAIHIFSGFGDERGTEWQNMMEGYPEDAWWDNYSFNGSRSFWKKGTTTWHSYKFWQGQATWRDYTVRAPSNRTPMWLSLNSDAREEMDDGSGMVDLPMEALYFSSSLWEAARWVDTINGTEDCYDFISERWE